MAGKKQERREMKYASSKEIATKQQRGYELSSIILPKGVNLFGFKEPGSYKLDVLPFEAKAGNTNTDPGFYTWERTYYVHKGIGPEQKSYCCLVRTFKEMKCPVCEQVVKWEREGKDKKSIDALKPKRRQLIAVRNLKELDKGVQVYEGPYNFGLGELIDLKIDATEEDHPYRNFFYLEGGSTLDVKVTSTPFSTDGGHSGKFNKPTNVEMVARAKDLPDSLLEEVPALDDLPRRLSYAELRRIFLQIDDDDEESKDRSSSNGKGASRVTRSTSVSSSHDEDEEDDEDKPDEDDGDEEAKDEKEDSKDEESKFTIGAKVMYKRIPCTIFKVGRDGSTVSLESDDSGDSFQGVKVELLTLIEDDETPARKRRS